MSRGGEAKAESELDSSRAARAHRSGKLDGRCPSRAAGDASTDAWEKPVHSTKGPKGPFRGGGGCWSAPTGLT